MLSNAYFLTKFRFDTAENEPAKNLQNFRKMHFRRARAGGRGPAAAAPCDVARHLFICWVGSQLFIFSLNQTWKEKPLTRSRKIYVLLHLSIITRIICFSWWGKTTQCRIQDTRLIPASLWMSSLFWNFFLLFPKIEQSSCEKIEGDQWLNTHPEEAINCLRKRVMEVPLRCKSNFHRGFTQHVRDLTPRSCAMSVQIWNWVYGQSPLKGARAVKIPPNFDNSPSGPITENPEMRLLMKKPTSNYAPKKRWGLWPRALSKNRNLPVLFSQSPSPAAARWTSSPMFILSC